MEDMVGDRLIDYVDWVAGTSTGSFVSAGLCVGWSEEETDG